MAQMGIGVLGQPQTIIKRKFRYTMEFTTPAGPIPRHFVKVANRPQLDLDETEVHFLNAITWLPGKGRWQPITITYIDVASKEMQGLYDWVASVYDFNKYADGAHLPQTERSGWDATGTISVYDGCGNEMERWTLKGCFPQSINFGDLDYGSSDEMTIDLTVRFDRAKLEGLNGCSPTPNGICRGCTNQ